MLRSLLSTKILKLPSNVLYERRVETRRLHQKGCIYFYCVESFSDYVYY